jgi:hypothetical protein
LPVTIASAITIAITMSKPEKPIYPHFNTQTPELRQRIDTAIAAIPPDHWVRPKKNELFADPETAFIRLRDWGFTQGILLVKESMNSRSGRWVIDCSRHHKETRNARNTPLKKRQRLGTHSQANDCKFGLYISQQSD